MSIPYTVSVQVLLKKDQKRVESKKNPLLGGKQASGESVTTTTFDGEKLSMISTIFKDKNKSGFTEKTASIVIKITKGDKARSVGMINLNLANYIDNEAN